MEELLTKEWYSKKEVEEFIERAKIAGYFDGEGCVCLQTTRKNPAYYQLVIQLSNTFLPKLQKLQSTYGGGISDIHSKLENRLPAQLWRVHSDNALAFLESIFPFSEDKHSQIEIGIGVLQYMQKKGRKRLTDYDRNYLAWAHEQLKLQKKDTSRLAGTPRFDGFDQPELTIRAEGDELEIAFSDQLSQGMFASSVTDETGAVYNSNTTAG